MTDAQYPEHKKLAIVSDTSQSIGEFLDWLSPQGILMMTWQEWDEDEPCDWCDGGAEIAEGETSCRRGIPACDNGVRQRHYEMYVHHRESIQDILARYFNIDLVKIEEEKRAMLDEQRILNAEADAHRSFKRMAE